jgi:hypothetical protein
MIYTSYWYDFDGDFAFMSSLLCLIFPSVVYFLYYVFFLLIPTVHLFFMWQQLLLLWDVLHVASGSRLFCHHPTERSLQTARFWAGCDLSSLRLKIDSSIPLPTTLPTLLAAWCRGRESRVVWLKQAACMRDQVVEPSISLLATVYFCLCCRVWWTGDNTNVTENDIDISVTMVSIIVERWIIKVVDVSSVSILDGFISDNNFVTWKASCLLFGYLPSGHEED